MESNKPAQVQAQAQNQAPPARPAVVQQPAATPDYSNMTPAEQKRARRQALLALMFNDKQNEFVARKPG